MASDNSAEIERLRGRIREMMRRVPASISSAGVQRVRAYKKALTDAKKQLDSSRPTLAAVQAAHNNLQMYE